MDGKTEKEMQQMDVPTLVANALQTNSHWIALALEGLSDDDLLCRPNAQCNPMGWTLWHQYRVEDRIMAAISGREQVWITGGWHAQFALPADSRQIGQGDTIEQVMALRPTIRALQGYGAAVREQTLAYLQRLTPTDLDRELPAPGGGTRSVGDYIGTFIRDHFHHSGQVCYLRTYLKGEGWFPR